MAGSCPFRKLKSGLVISSLVIPNPLNGAALSNVRPSNASTDSRRDETKGYRDGKSDRRFRLGRFPWSRLLCLCCLPLTVTFPFWSKVFHTLVVSEWKFFSVLLTQLSVHPANEAQKSRPASTPRFAVTDRIYSQIRTAHLITKIKPIGRVAPNRHKSYSKTTQIKI